MITLSGVFLYRSIDVLASRNMRLLGLFCSQLKEGVVPGSILPPLHLLFPTIKICNNVITQTQVILFLRYILI